MYKAKAGARDAYHEAIGTMNTEQKWEAERPRLSKNVEAWLVETKFGTCRGCHDLEKFGGKANPMVVEMHAGVLKQDNFNCLECHQGVGHVYIDKKAQAPAGHGSAALAAK
jgi:trimethylamine-N-oxide reductase cytochrome c-type subunit TorC